MPLENSDLGHQRHALGKNGPFISCLPLIRASPTQGQGPSGFQLLRLVEGDPQVGRVGPSVPLQ